MKNRAAGASLLEIVLIVGILALIAAAFVPLASGLVDVQRSNSEIGELKAIYSGIVGDPRSNTFGYLGDVGSYPSSLLDLVQLPASNPAGWNGPYINNLRIESGVLYDQFGGLIEYFHPGAVAGSIDELGLISRGPDRTSTNSSTIPNQSSGFTGTFPTNSGYGTAISNTDNVVFPAFTDNTSLVNYQSLGQVSFNINDFDENATVTDFVPACPGVYNIVISSLTHPTFTDPNEAYMTYAQGGAVVDLLQGTYLAKVFVGTAHLPVSQEQISVAPGVALTRNLWLPGVNSSLGGTVNLTVTNSTSVKLQIQEYGVNKGGQIATSGPASTLTQAVQPCSRINIEDTTTSGHPILDSFIMPIGAYTKRYVTTQTFYTLTVSNTSINAVAIYDDGILAGTIGKHGNKNVKTFSIKSGDIITIADDNNSLVEPTFTMSGNISKSY